MNYYELIPTWKWLQVPRYNRTENLKWNEIEIPEKLQQRRGLLVFKCNITEQEILTQIRDTDVREQINHFPA